MAFKIYSENDIHREEWSALTGNTFFVSPDFASLWRAKKGEPVYCVDDVNGVIRAGMTGVICGRSPLRRYDSMPDGFFGGPYFTADYNEENKQRFIVGIEEYIRSRKIIRATISRPVCRMNLSKFNSHKLTAHVLKLEDDVYRPPRREVRKHIRGSKERGGRVERFEREEELERFYKLAVVTKKRHGQKPAYPLEFFRRLFELSRHNSSVLWLKVMLDDVMIASQISFIDGHEALNWQFYYDKKYSYYKPGYLLLDHALNYCVDNGVRVFSMGSTPDDLNSLVLYKERWGGERVEYDYYTYYNWLGSLLYGWRGR